MWQGICLVLLRRSRRVEGRGYGRGDRELFEAAIEYMRMLRQKEAVGRGGGSRRSAGSARVAAVVILRCVQRWVGEREAGRGGAYGRVRRFAAGIERLLARGGVVRRRGGRLSGEARGRRGCGFRAGLRASRCGCPSLLRRKRRRRARAGRQRAARRYIGRSHGADSGCAERVGLEGATGVRQPFAESFGCDVEPGVDVDDERAKQRNWSKRRRIGRAIGA
jgi:hypothetical protein